MGTEGQVIKHGRIANDIPLNQTMETKTEPESENEVRHYLSLIGHKVQVLLRRIEGFQRRSYPTNDPIALANILTRILARSFDELQRLEAQIGQRKPSDIVDRAWFVHRFAVRYLSQWIEAIDHADVSTTTGGIIDAFNAICNQAQFGTCLIIYPTWKYNFSFEDVSENLVTVAKRIGGVESPNLFEGQYPHYVIVTYPYIEEETALGQILIAHEVGHFIDTARGWSREIEDKPLFSAGVDNVPGGIDIGEREIALRLLQYIGGRWLKEIVADTIAASILGPAYVLAFNEFTFGYPYLRSGTKEIAVSHPPDELRLRLMAEFTHDMHLGPLLELPDYALLSERSKTIYGYVSETLNSYRANRTTFVEGIQQYDIAPCLVKWIYDQLAAAMDAVIVEVKAKAEEVLTENWTCSPDDILHGLILSEYLENGYTPTELPSFCKDRPSFAGIMNSGWFHLLSQKRESRFFLFDSRSALARRPSEINEAYVSTHQLVAKAIETHNFQNIFAQRHGEYRKRR